MTMQIGVQNTSNQDFELKAFGGNLYANNNNIGTVSSFGGIVIEPRSETYIEVKVRLSILQIVNNIISQIEAGTFRETLKLDAYVNVDNLQVPIEVIYKFGN